jgi:hypothetical protein
MKVCKRCKQNKDESQYYGNRKKCKKCHNSGRGNQRPEQAGEIQRPPHSQWAENQKKRARAWDFSNTI